MSRQDDRSAWAVRKRAMASGFTFAESQAHPVLDRFTTEHKRRFAVELLQRQTSAEQALWLRLDHRAIGYSFRRQAVLWGYIADFYCDSVRLAVEVDGGYHATDKQRAYDRFRDAVLAEHGVYVLRLTNEQALVASVAPLLAIWTAADQQRQRYGLPERTMPKMFRQEQTA